MELELFKKIVVYEHVSREEALVDSSGEVVQVYICCRLVAQELGYGEALRALCGHTDRDKCEAVVVGGRGKGPAKHSARCRARLLIQGHEEGRLHRTPTTRARSTTWCRVIGKLRQAIRGARGAPHIFLGLGVRGIRVGLGLRASELHPPMPGIIVADFLPLRGLRKEVQWLFGAFDTKFDLKEHVLVPGNQDDIAYHNKVSRRGAPGGERVGDPKHAQTLRKE